MARIVLAFIALAILGMIGTAAFQAGLAEAGSDEVVTNETFVPDAGNVTTLDNSNRNGVYYSDNATVYDENGTLMSYGTDYIWYSANGTVKAVSGGGLDGDASAEISYQYQVTTRAQRQLTGLLGNIPAVLGFALPIGALMFLLFLVRGGA